MKCRLVVATVLVFAGLVSAQEAKTQAAPEQVQDIRRVTIPDPVQLNQMSVAELEKLGDDLRSNKEMLQAVDCYNAALKKTPKSSVIYNKIGMAYLSIREYRRARKALERSIKLNKTYPEAYNNLGAVWYAEAFSNPHKKNEGKIRRSVHYYEKAIKLNKFIASFHSNLGTAYIDLKDYDRGISEYRQAFQLDPMIFERNSKTGIAARLSSPEDLGEYNYFMAKLYAGNGLDDKALLYLGHAMENGYKHINDVYKDPEFAKLRADKRFEALMASRPEAITQ